MVKIALLVPNKKMLEIASSIAEEQHICVEYMKEIQTVDAVKEARLAIESGAHIIVARGYQTTVGNTLLCRRHSHNIGELLFGMMEQS